VQWFGVLAPAATARDIVARLHSDVLRTLQSAEIKDRFASDGADPVGSTPEEFAAFLRAETAKWSKVVKNAGIQPE
jgi:tripartite-type tricarboxylate transporter receptor subunit TctC